MANSRLEQYVETVAARLQSLPESEQQQQITKLRQHLEAIIFAGQAKGVSEEIATEAAQFGEAEVGAELILFSAGIFCTSVVLT